VVVASVAELSGVRVDGVVREVLGVRGLADKEGAGVGLGNGGEVNDEVQGGDQKQRD